MAASWHAFQCALVPLLADQRPILRSEPAVPRDLTAKFSWWPAMCQVDPFPPVVTGGFGAFNLRPLRSIIGL